MLKQLFISNFALIESLHIDFSAGLNIITGETGAGKSVVVDALMLVLGERASADLIREGADKAIVEGHFRIETKSEVNLLLEEHEYDTHSDNLIIRRELTKKGQSRSFINDSPAPYHFVKTLGEKLVDFHGQHSHQSLFRTDEHLRLLENLIPNHALKNEYAEVYNVLKNLIKERKRLLDEEFAVKAQMDFNKFQLQELSEINPRLNEFEDLNRELVIAENAEKIVEHCNRVYEATYEQRNNVQSSLITIISSIENLCQYDSSFSEYLLECKSALVALEESVRFTQAYKQSIEFEPEKIEAIRERLVQLTRLKKKYGSVENAISIMETLRKDVSNTIDFEEQILKLENDILLFAKKVGETGTKLSNERTKTANDLTQQIIMLLSGLGITHSNFEVKFLREEREFSFDDCTACIGNKFFSAYETGLEKAEFYISTNKGESLKPLVKTASGGEVSRIMLALKTILAKSDRLPMLVFDEIDTGISGRIAQKVGKSMKELAGFHQIIAITHLPQVAAFADVHIIVEKTTANNRTVVTARAIDSEEHIYEVAKLLSGENVSVASLESARQLVRI